MINNDVLRRLRYTFDFDDNKMIAIFALGRVTANRDDVRSWLKQEEDADYKTCGNGFFMGFLDGLIIEKRGPKDGPAAAQDQTMNNNVVFRKLKIALNLKAEDILALLELVEFNMSKHELSAFFRKADHKHFRECKDQILRNFLNGIQKKFRVDTPASVEQWKKQVEARTYVKNAKKKAAEAKAEEELRLAKGKFKVDMSAAAADLKTAKPSKKATSGPKKTLGLKTSTLEKAPATEKAPVVEKAAAVEKAPIAEKAPAVEKAPVAEKAPVVEKAAELSPEQKEAQEKSKSKFKF